MDKIVYALYKFLACQQSLRVLLSMQRKKILIKLWVY